MNIVYLITNTNNGMMYVGSKMNWRGPGTYWGSSKNQLFREHFDNNPEHFKFEELHTVDGDPRPLEGEEIKARNAIKSDQYYNMHFYGLGWGTHGQKRPGIGGVPKGRPSPNKGKKCPGAGKKGNTASKDTFKRRWGSKYDELIELYKSRPPLKTCVSRNGRYLPYMRAFSKHYYRQFPIGTPEGLYLILKKAGFDNKI